jgi:superfamily II DNA or RNA helicase
MLTTAKAFGAEHGPFIADWAEASALPLYKGFISSPVEALLTLQQKGYQDITDPFGVLATRVIERHESKPREGLAKDLAHLYAQRELIPDPGYEAAQLMALRMQSLVQYSKAGRPSADSTVEKWKEFWNKTTIQAAESLERVDPQEALFDDVSLKFYQNFKDTVIADMGPGELQAEEIQYQPSSEGNPQVKRLKQHEENQLKKATADRRPVPQKLSDEIYAIEQALGQEFMGFFKQTRLREEELAKRHAEKEELRKRHQAKEKPPAFPITNRQQDFLIEPGAQMGLFEASSAQYLPFEEGELHSTRGEKAADPRALREGAEVELKFGTPGLQDFLDTQGLTEDKVTGIGQVTSYKKSEGRLIADILFEEGGQLRLEWTPDGMPVEAIQPALYVHERGAPKEHERILGPKEAKAEGIQKEIEFGDKRELPPPPDTKMIRARADLVPKLKDVWGHKFLSSWVKEHHPILKPHQADAVVRSLSAMIGPEGEGGHFLNSSGTGSGKTMTQLAVADYMAKYGQEGDYTLILTENRGIMHSAFAKDAELMGIPIHEFGGKPPEKDKKIYIGTYTDVQMMKVKPGEFNTIIMDEAHNIRNMLINTATAKRADRLVKAAKHVMYATASPMDQPHQIYAYRHLLDISVPRAMAKMGLEQNSKGQWTPIKDMTWEQIEENIDVVWEDVYAAGKAIKDEVPLNNTEIFYRNVKLTPRDVLTIQKKMELLEEHYLATSNNPTAGGLERLKKNQGRKFLESVKMKYAIAEAKKHIKDGKKVILFAHRVAGESTIGTNEETLAAYEMSLQNEGVKTARLFGPMTKGKKQGEMAKFQEGVADIVLATPGSGGTGVSLDDAYGDKPRVTIIVTPPYSSLEFIQMIGRASRLTTQSKSEVVVPLTTHPVDRWNIGITLRKLEALKAAVKGDIKKPKGVKEQLEAEQIPYITEEEVPLRERRERQKAEERAAFLKASLQSSQSVAAREHLLHLLRPGSSLPGGKLISGIDFEVNKFGVADLLNRRVEGEHEVAALTSLIRNPYVESSHLVGLDNTGNVIISEWGGLGAPHIAPAAKDFLSRALALGVKKLVVVHNEPIGEDLATSSPRDQEVIDAYNDFIPTTGIVHDFTKYKVLNPNGPSEHHQYPKELVDGYLTTKGTKQSASLIGKKLSKYSPEIADYVIDANAIAKSISESKYGVGWGNNLAVALLGPHGHLRAVMEMDPALAATNDGIDYIRRQAAAAGATKAFGVYTAEAIANSKHYSGFVNLHQSGVLTDIMGYADINQTTLQKISQRLPRPTLPNHLLGVPIESWGEFEAQSAEYNPSNESSDEAYTYRMLGPGGKMTKVPVKLGGMENVRPMKMTWLVKLYESVMGKRPKVQHIPQRGGMKVHGYHKGGDIVIDVGMFTDEMRAAQTLAHEIGHWVDFMDDRTMARGNVIGRLKSLHNFMKKRFGNLDDAELREELKELSMYWRPWDPENSPASFKKYRNSSKELYADALSVLFNDPALLQELAPNFYRGFFEGIDSKPQLSQELIKLWETLDNDYVDSVQDRINDSLEEYAKGEEIIKQKAEEARNRRKHWKSWWDHLSFMLNYRHSKFEKKLAEAKDRGYNPSIETDPRVMVEESLWWAENHNTRYLKKSFDVIKELEAEGVSYDVLGKWLELDRIINERSSLANPGGVGPLAAKEQLIALRNRLGPRRSGLIQNWAAPRLHDLFFEVAEMAAQEGVINATTFDRVIKPNRNAYVPFAVMNYLQASMPAGIKRQYGTFEKIANPLTSMLMKAVSMHNFIAVNKAKRTVRDHLLEWHGGDIKKTAVKKYRDPAIKDKEANPFWEKIIPDPDFGVLTVFENGRPVHYDVDPLIADGFDHQPHASVQAMAGFFTETFQKFLYPIFITYNIGFHGSNLIRDFGRTRRSLKLTRRGMLKQYMDALDAGLVRMKGSNEHPMIAEMMDNMAIGPANKRHLQHYDEQGTVGQQLEEYGLINPEPETLMDKLGKYRVMSWFSQMGDLFEALPKIATYRYLREYNKKTPRDSGFTVRNYVGTPHTRRAGAYASIIKGKMPFFNVFKEGMKADYEMASGSYGHTRTHPHKKGHSSSKDKAKKNGWERAKTASGWWWWYIRAHGLAALFQGLADGGFLGDDAKELYNGVSEYDKTNYLVVPLGQQSGGDFGKKTVYMRVPRDFTAQFISGLIYKLTRQFGDNPSKLHEALNYTVEQGPSDNPIFTVPATWLEYAQGKNPEDAFRDRPILNHTQEGLRGLEGAKGMATWSLNQVGARDAFNLTKLADDENDGFIATLALHTPLVNRFIKVSDYGYREQQFNKLSEKQRASLIHREKYGEATKDALRKYYQLQRFGEQGRTPQQEEAYRDLSWWYRNDYTPFNTDILSAMELDMKSQSEKLRRTLEKLTKAQFKD